MRKIGANPAFAPGFRISTLDSFVLLAGIAAAIGFGAFDLRAGFIIGMPTAHFFLFCNVFRISRPPELIWAGLFVALVAATLLWGGPGWAATAIVSVCAAAAAIAFEMRKASYHGVFWRTVNPRLPVWWEGRRSDVDGA